VGRQGGKAEWNTYRCYMGCCLRTGYCFEIVMFGMVYHTLVTHVWFGLSYEQNLCANSSNLRLARAACGAK